MACLSADAFAPGTTHHLTSAVTRIESHAKPHLTRRAKIGVEIACFAMSNSTKESAMTRADLTEKLLDIKREKGWTWKFICEQIGGMSPVMITGGVLGQQKMTKPMADAAAKLFGLTKSEQALLNEVPMRGTGTPMPPTDPLIYRFYELVMVNGPAWKALIEEEFGDGIMSAIDFDMTIDRQPDPKGDRVKIGMTGKFLPFKYYGATGNALPYGLKEE